RAARHRPLGPAAAGVRDHAAAQATLRSRRPAQPRPLRRRPVMTAPRRLLDDCVHCGFCLPSCPTYQSWGEEMDSPRGRIHLMRSIAEGNEEFSDTVISHFDRCLGCMACVTACPSGVTYDSLIVQTRAAIEE